MDKYEVIEELKKLIGDYLLTRGFVLVELVYRYEGRDLMLRVLADRAQGGINLEECAALNEGIGNMLDEKGVPESHYVLEVSSPGLDRPLTTEEDFMRYPGKAVHLFLKEPQDTKWEMEGVISKVGHGSLFIEVGENTVEIPFHRINKAKQVIK